MRMEFATLIALITIEICVSARIIKCTARGVVFPRCWSAAAAGDWKPAAASQAGKHVLHMNFIQFAYVCVCSRYYVKVYYTIPREYE